MTGCNSVRVLESFRSPRTTTNPYIIQLARALEQTPGCEPLTFSFRRAIFGSYDIFHVHWPEVIYAQGRGVKALIREFLFAMVLVRIQLGEIPIVRTRHNIVPHSGLNRRQRFLEARVERLTTANIRINDTTETSFGVAVTTIPHGHYVDWFADCAVQPATPGRIAYFGLIRPYKGVENLLSAFLKTSMPGLSLSISGQPSLRELEERLRQMAQDCSQVELDFKYLTDPELVTAVSKAELVVLPYQFMHNSGAVLAALSLNRPVLVPDTIVNRWLAHEVGPGWVHLFSGEVDAQIIESAISLHRSNPPTAAPDLSARSWRTTGVEHLRVFESALRRKALPDGATSNHRTIDAEAR